METPDIRASSPERSLSPGSVYDVDVSSAQQVVPL
jgi:hypothetical protein